MYFFIFFFYFPLDVCVTNFYSVCYYEVFLSIIDSIYIIDDYPHAGSVSTVLYLGVSISQVGQDVVKKMVSLFHKAILKRLHAISDPLPEVLILEKPLNGLPNIFQVAHNVPGGKQLGLFFFKFPCRLTWSQN